MQRYYSGLYRTTAAAYAVGCAFGAAALGALLGGWLGTAAAAGAAALAARLAWVSLKAGVWIGPRDVVSRGYLGSNRTRRDEVLSVIVRNRGQWPSGYLTTTAGGITPLRGVSDFHQHGLAMPGRRGQTCTSCLSSRVIMDQIASSLSVPLIDRT